MEPVMGKSSGLASKIRKRRAPLVAASGADGIHWYVDAPVDGMRASSDTITLAGWTVDENDPIARIAVLNHGREIGGAQVGGCKRLDLATIFESAPWAVTATWEFRLTLEQAELPLELQFEATCSDGTRRRFPGHPIRVATADDAAARNYRLALPAPFGAVTHPTGPIALAEPMRVGGWALLPDTSMSRVEILLDGKPVGHARICQPRPDVAATWGEEGALSGFQATVDFGRLEPGTSTRVGAVVHGVDGSVFELPPVDLLIESSDSARVAALPVSDERIATLRSRATDSVRRVRAQLHEAATGTRPRVVVLTHHLGLGGGQLWLHELIMRLASDHDIDIVGVATAANGTLRDDLEAAGIPVHATTYPDQRGPDEYEGAVGELAMWVASQSADVAIVNTAGMFHAADACGLAGVPVIWGVHESFTLPTFMMEGFGTGLNTRYLVERLTATLQDARAVVFEADATRELYASQVADSSAFRTLDYGIDIAAIDAWTAEHDRDRIRSKLEFTSDQTILLCMGTVEPRKGQAALIHAFAQIADSYPNAQLVCVGDIGGDYAKSCRRTIDAHGLGDRVRLERITSDTWPWYHAADCLILSSDIESLPRTALEAMAFCTPVMATNVFGLAELIDDGTNGFLFDPNDLTALIAAMERVLATSMKERERLVAQARTRIEERHDGRGYAREVAGLIAEIVADRSGEQVLDIDTLAVLRRDFSTEERAIIERVQPYTMTSEERIVSLTRAVQYVVDAGIPGAIVECGVWRGGSMMAAALALQDAAEVDRELYLYDTFEGMTAPTSEDVAAGDGSAAADLLAGAEKSTDSIIWAWATLDQVRDVLAETAYPEDLIHLVAGPVEETIPGTVPEQIALLRLDTDWYESTKHELEHLYSRIAPGGVLIIDDYGDWNGARQAVDEFNAKLGQPLLLCRIDHTGRIAIKPSANLTTIGG